MSKNMPIEHLEPADVFAPGTYAQCVRVGNTVYIAGQTAVDAKGNLVGGGDVRAQAVQVWTNIGNLLRAAGGGYSNLVRMTTYLTDMAHRSVSMEVRQQFLGEHR